jgi:hypothetical protein
VSSRLLPSVALREHIVVDLCGDEGDSQETADSGVPPDIG